MATQLVRVKASGLPTDDLVVVDEANHQLQILTTDDGQRTMDKRQRTNAPGVARLVERTGRRLAHAPERRCLE